MVVGRGPHSRDISSLNLKIAAGDVCPQKTTHEALRFEFIHSTGLCLNP